MRPLRIALAALLIVVGGVHSQREISFSLSTGMTSYEQRKTAEAVAEWNAALQGDATLLLFPIGSTATWRIDFDTDQMEDKRRNACETHHLTKHIHCNPRAFVSRMDMPTPCNFRATISHEIGHALGILDHPGGLMRERCHIWEHPVDQETARLARKALQSGR